MRLTATTERRRASTSGEARDRRAGRGRDSLELVLDRIFRPANWAARLAHGLRLQGAGGVRLRTYLIPLHRARAGAPPIRIAFASDFHAGATTDNALLQQACALLDGAKPDVLLLGGDFVSVRASYIRNVAPLIAKIHAPLGKFAVLGNHDLRAHREELTGALEDAGVKLLVNSSARLPAPHDDIAICGIDDPIFGSPDVDAALDGADGVRIVLMHAPDGLLDLGERHFDLALCGHTHGGQIVFPWGGVLVAPRGELSRKYCSGIHRLGPGGMRALLVSRGIGCSTIPVRLFAHPEVHLLVVG